MTSPTFCVGGPAGGGGAPGVADPVAMFVLDLYFSATLSDRIPTSSDCLPRITVEVMRRAG